MTFLNLENALIEEISRILADIHTTSADGELITGVNGFKNKLPLIESDEESDSQFSPFFIVFTSGGKTEDDADWWHVDVSITFGVHDDTPEGGHEHILIMCQRVLDRFAAEPLLDRRYRAEQDMRFMMSDEDAQSYYYGGVGITFSVPKIGRRNPIHV